VPYWYLKSAAQSGHYIRVEHSRSRSYSDQKSIKSSFLLIPEVDLLSETGGVGGVLVAAVHLIHTVVIGISIAGPAGPLLKHAETQYQFQQQCCQSQGQPHRLSLELGAREEEQGQGLSENLDADIPVATTTSDSSCHLSEPWKHRQG